MSFPGREVIVGLVFNLGGHIMSQHSKILKHLRVTKGLTQREALLDYSIQSFTKRISELRRQGFNIVSVPGKHPITGQRYTRYVLQEEA